MVGQATASVPAGGLAADFDDSDGEAQDAVTGGGSASSQSAAPSEAPAPSASPAPVKPGRRQTVNYSSALDDQERSRAAVAAGAQASSGPSRNKHFEEDTVADLQEIPELEAQGEEDLTRAVAQAPRLASDRRVAALADGSGGLAGVAGAGGLLAAAGADLGDLDLGVLTGCLVPAEQAEEADIVWDPPATLNALAAQLRAEEESFDLATKA